MDAEVPDFGLFERSRRGRCRNLGRIELAAVVLDANNQVSAIALDLDRDFQTLRLGGAVHDDIGDGFFEAKRNGERHVG